MSKQLFTLSLLITAVLIFGSIIYSQIYPPTPPPAILLGPALGQWPVSQIFNTLAFLFTLVLMLRIGPGQLSYPLLFFKYSFLSALLGPLLFGSPQSVWFSPLLSSVFGFLGILALIWVLGIIDVILKGR